MASLAFPVLHLQASADFRKGDDKLKNWAVPPWLLKSENNLSLDKPSVTHTHTHTHPGTKDKQNVDWIKVQCYIISKCENGLKWFLDC